MFIVGVNCPWNLSCCLTLTACLPSLTQPNFLGLPMKKVCNDLTPGTIQGHFKCRQPNCVCSTSIWIISWHVHKDTASHSKKCCSTIKSCWVYEVKPDISHTTKVTTTTLQGEHSGHITQAVIKRQLQMTFIQKMTSHYLDYSMEGTKCVRCGLKTTTKNPLLEIFKNLPLDAINFNINVLCN